jgi:regulator of replication initiation timing
MGEAKRRQKYWQEQGETPPINLGQSSVKTKIDAIKQQIHQIKADTAQVKKDPEFKRQCQEKLAAENRQIKERLEKRDFRAVSDIIAMIQARSGKLTPEQVDLWMDYLISGLLNTKNIEPVQAQLFIWELETQLQLNSAKSYQAYDNLSQQIAAMKAYLKSLEVWVDIKNDLLAIYQVRSSIL